MPVAGAAVFVVVFFVAPPVTPLLIEPMTPFFVVAAVALVAAVRFTTVPVLASLVSLLPLALRAFLVAGREGGARGAGARLVLAAVVVPFELELVLEAAVTFLAVPALVAFAFSTMLESIFVAAAAERAVPEFLRGEAGRAICDFVGDAGRVRFARREFDEVGDRTWAGRTWAASAAWAARTRFFAFSRCSISFSLSPEIASLDDTLIK